MDNKGERLLPFFVYFEFVWLRGKVLCMNEINEDLPFLIALTMINGVGNYLGKTLLGHFGSAQAVFKTNRKELRKVPGIGTLTSNNIVSFKKFDEVNREVELLEKKGIRAISLFDDAYPYRLKEIDDNPLVLFCKGTADLNPKRIIAIVGSRNSSSYGKQVTEDIIQALSSHQVTIVSGLAAGTDTNVHKACLKHGLATIGVLGHGFQTMYPGSNRSLANEMTRSGAVMTEYRFEVPGSKENFPKRNRIVAGMVDAVIVVESGRNGGSMITADLANQYNRDVFAIPGKLSDLNSAGCNRLIQINQAAIIDSISGLVNYLGYNNQPKPKASIQPELFSNLSDEELMVLRLLESGPKGVDDLLYGSDLQMRKLALILLNLEFKGLLRSHPGKVYALAGE